MTDLSNKKEFNPGTIKECDLIAYLGFNCSFSDYIVKYRLAVNALIESFENHSICNFDMISLPVLHLIRHVYELSIKGLVTYFEYFLNVGLPVILENKTHRISTINNYCIQYLREYKRQDFLDEEKAIINSFEEVMKKLGSELERIDDTSTKLRYHKDSKIEVLQELTELKDLGVKNKKKIVSSFEIDEQLNAKILLELYYKFNNLIDELWYNIDRRNTLENPIE